MGKLIGNNSENEQEKKRLLPKGVNSGAYRNLQYSETQKATIFGNGISKNNAMFTKAFNCCFATVFEPMQVKSTINTLTLMFPISHNIHKGHFLDMFCGTPPKCFTPEEQKNNPAISYLQFKFTSVGDDVFLQVACDAYPDIYHYDLLELLTIFIKLDELQFRIDEVHRYKESEVQIMHLLTLADINSDESSIKFNLKQLVDYNINCLKRFEELTYHRDEEAYKNSQALGRILNEIVKNYKLVTNSEYQIALQRLDIVEENETYKNDPQIALSLTKIRSALETLRDRAFINGRGIALDEQQLNLIIEELFKHEGSKPEEGIWFPRGSVAEFIAQLETSGLLKMAQISLSN